MQTSIFKEIAIKKINDLIDLQNEGLKEKDKHHIVAIEPISEFYIIEIKNMQGSCLWNVVDRFGDIPKDFCVNWRLLTTCLDEIDKFIENNSN